MYTYLIRFKPIDNYFFSDRTTFNYTNGKENKIINYNGKKIKETNYYVQSKKYPQQTTILGVLRKEILMIKGLYEEDRTKYNNNDKLKDIISTIGNGSFNVRKTKNTKFGIIEELSPVFLCKKYDDSKNLLVRKRLNSDYELKKENGKTLLSNIKDKTFILSNYESKSGISKKLTYLKDYNKDSNPAKNEFNEDYSENEIFIKDARIGINTNTEENGFYKQEYYRLKKDFEFAVYASFSEEIFNDTYKNIVTVGAEGKLFEINAKKIDNKKSNEYINNIINSTKKTTNKDYKTINLIGDAIIDEEHYKKIKNESLFINGETSFFKNYIYEKGNEYKDGKAYLLLSRGSVIYCSDEKYEEIRKIIENDYYKSIGYNWII